MPLPADEPVAAVVSPVAASPDLLSLLAAAQQSLVSWQERFADYSGNNPDKYRTDIDNARREVDRLTELCKRAGLIETTDSERIGYALDALYPKAQSREVVLHEGRYYQKRFSPGSMSRSRKTVTAWEHRWDELAPEHEDVQRLVDPTGVAEKEAREVAVRKHWPWAVPAGGLKLQLQVSEPALLSAISGKSAVGYTKGRPDLRVSLKVSLALSEAALERCQRDARDRHAKDLWLGQQTNGLQCYLVKTGRAAADIGLDARPA